MIHIRPEGQLSRYGLNLYPWRERACSIGFVLRLPWWRWRLRYAPKTGRLHSDCGFCPTIKEESRLYERWQAGLAD